MDPISQAITGAIAAQSIAPKEQARFATMMGTIGGMFADADIFIRSDSDPLLNLEYHRHFSHSLIFIPIGGLIVASFFWLFPCVKRYISFKHTYLYATIAYATSGILDAFTAYGTQLFWPFSNARVAWDNMPIIDPIYTFTLILLALIGFIIKKPKWGRIAAVFACLYFCLGFLQNHRAKSAIVELAKERGHIKIAEHRAMASPLSLLLWRSIYLHKGHYYADAVHVSPFGKTKIYKGASIPKWNPESFISKLPEGSTLAKDIVRFSHFTSDTLTYHQDGNKILIGDFRYALLPNSIEPLWGIYFSPQEPDQHPNFVNFTQDRKEAIKLFKKMVLGKEMKKE